MITGEKMDTFRFNFNTNDITDLREAVNERRKQSMDNVHSDKDLKNYFAWDRTCAAMTRLEDTVNYLNHIELGTCTYWKLAFDFYDFLNNAFVIIDCIKTLGHIFRMDNKLIEDIENSYSVFGSNAKDGIFFEYIRSLCAVHPLKTNHQSHLLNGSKFHCCPYVMWVDKHLYRGENIPDLYAVIYTSIGENSESDYLKLYISQFKEYITKWLNLIPEIIKAKNEYTDSEYERLRKEPVKSLDECQGNIIEYIDYIKNEYYKRFDYGNEYIFDRFSRAFKIKLSDSRNEELLRKYQNAIIYSLQFAKNELQNMSYLGYENTGINYPDPNVETTLVDELGKISAHRGSFSKYSYAIEKLYYLEDEDYHPFDKDYARRLLESPKELINKYVHFTNMESDEETTVLVALALYFDALENKNLLNKNIPNEEKYRISVLPKEQYDELFVKEEPDESQIESAKSLLSFLKEYGG